MASIFSATLLPSEFVPASDTGRSIISLELPPGSTLDETRRVSRHVTEIVAKIPEVQNVFVDGGAGSIAKATIVVNFGQKGERERSSFSIEDERFLEWLNSQVATIL